MSKASSEPFRKAASRVRSSYLRTLRQLPKPLRGIALRHLESRLQRAGGRPLLGEYAPWLIADLLGIADIPAVRRLASGWLHVYFFVLILDDVIDQPHREIPADQLIVGSLLLQRGLCRLVRGRSHGKLFKQMDTSFEQTACAALEELQGLRARMAAFASHGPDQVGQKIALLRLCGRALAQEKRLSASRSEQIDLILERFAVGVQLLDDITDWQEDLRMKRHSFLLVKAQERGGNMKRISTDPTRGLFRLLETGALLETLRAARSALEDTILAMDQVEPRRCSASRAHVMKLLTSSEVAIMKLEALRRNVYTARTAAKRRELARDITEVLIPVAQGS